MVGKNRNKSAQGKTVVVSLKRGDDLLFNILETCRKHDIKQGFIPTMVAALSNIELSVSVNGEFKVVTNANVKIKGPAEFLGMGTISQKKGHTYLHLHGAFGSKGRQTVIGHLISAKVAIVAEIIIQEIEGIKMQKQPDPKLFNYPVLNIAR